MMSDIPREYNNIIQELGGRKDLTEDEQRRLAKAHLWDELIHDVDYGDNDYDYD